MHRIFVSPFNRKRSKARPLFHLGILIIEMAEIRVLDSLTVRIDVINGRVMCGIT